MPYMHTHTRLPWNCQLFWEKNTLSIHYFTKDNESVVHRPVRQAVVFFVIQGPQLSQYAFLMVTSHCCCLAPLHHLSNKPAQRYLICIFHSLCVCVGLCACACATYANLHFLTNETMIFTCKRYCPDTAKTRSHSTVQLLYDPFEESPPIFHQPPPKQTPWLKFPCQLDDHGRFWSGWVGVFSLLWFLLCFRHKAVNPWFIHSCEPVYKAVGISFTSLSQIVMRDAELDALLGVRSFMLFL